MSVEFRLEACHSLKDKRARLAGLRQRFGKSMGLAVCESGHQDELSRAQWCFVATAADAITATRALDEVEQYVTSNLDAQVLNIRTFELN